MLNLADRARARFPSTEKFKVTESLVEEIQKDLKDFRANPVKIASKLNVPVALVRFIFNETPQPGSLFTVHSKDGWGRKNLRDFAIARKPASSDWPAESAEAIQQARDEYDAGTHELAQGRDGDFIILYKFPRNKKAKRDHKYFQLEEEF